MDYEEIEQIKFPAEVMIIETMGEDATDADLYNAGYNMFSMIIESLDDVPDGHEIHGVVEEDLQDE